MMMVLVDEVQDTVRNEKLTELKLNNSLSSVWHVDDKMKR